MQLLLYRLLTFISAPAALLIFLMRGDGLARVWDRLGLGPGRKEKALWFHAASVGEFRALKPLILRDWRVPVVVTVQSRQAFALASVEVPSTISVHAAPLDAPILFSGFLDRIRPSALVLVESELWPGWLKDLKQRGIPAVLLDGALSETSVRRWAGWSGLVRPMTQALRRITVSSLQRKAAFEGLGFERVEMALPLKLAGKPLPVSEGLLATWQTWKGQSPLIAFSNVHRSEITAIKGLVEGLQDAEKIIIAPRYPEQIGAFKAAFGAPNERLAYWTGFGTLGSLYALGGKVVIGGGFDAKIGSHNPLEALRAGCQVVCGPHAGKQADVLGLLRDRGLVSQANEWPGTASDVTALDDLADEAVQQAISTVESVLLQQ